MMMDNIADVKKDITADKNQQTCADEYAMAHNDDTHKTL